MDQSRYQFAFLRDSTSLNDLGTAFWWCPNGKAPSMARMTSPHSGMPCVFGDASVRVLRFSKDCHLDNDFPKYRPQYASVGADGMLLAKLWYWNDGGSVPAGELGD